MNGDKNEQLSPRPVPGDGNQLYTCFSMAMFDRSDLHQSIRSKVWDIVALKIFGMNVEALINHNNPPKIMEGVRREACFKEWLLTVDPRPNASEKIDLERLRLVLYNLIKASIHSGVRGQIYIVAPIVAETYGVGVVVYSTKAATEMDWSPSRTWHPPSYKVDGDPKYIHILSREDDMVIDLLVKSRKGKYSSIHKANASSAIPTHVVTSLSLKLKNRPTIDPWESEIIKNNAIYSLEAYDTASRKHYVLGRFVSPETGIDPLAKKMHYIRVDAATGKTDQLRFMIGGCKTTNVPIAIFAVYSKNGVQYASRIGGWKTDYVDPQICIKETDERIIIVPSGDPAEAARIVVAECQCILQTTRPVEGGV